MTSHRKTDRQIETNRATWDAWTAMQVASPFYDVEGFKAGRRGRDGLDALEMRLVGDVSGKSLLHLQCHIGLDTIAWARRGAAATGLDFSPRAIAAARTLAAELGVAAAFIESDLYELPARLTDTFDVVFTSHGVLPWLPDLDPWGRLIAQALRPGGRFCIIEGHPFAMIFDDTVATRSCVRRSRTSTPRCRSGRNGAARTPSRTLRSRASPTSGRIRSPISWVPSSARACESRLLGNIHL